MREALQFEIELAELMKRVVFVDEFGHVVGGLSNDHRKETAGDGATAESA